MKRSVFVCSLIILLVNVLSYGVGASSPSSLIIPLDPSDPGDTLTVADINWPLDFDQQIKLVNEGQGKFQVEIFNDPTIWEVVNYLKKQGAVLDSNQANLTMDGALNVARMQTVVRLLKAKGLWRLDFTCSPDRDDSSYIKISYLPYAQSNGQIDTSYVSRTDTVFVFSSFEKTYNIYCNLSIGGEFTAVSDGAPVIVPTLSLTVVNDNYWLKLTGGYRPGEFDQKFFAGSLTYFPTCGSWGVQTSLIYVSETVETFGAYVQQGYGLTLGPLWHKEKLSIHLAAGFQYFDRRAQDRRLEPTINLGLNYQILSL